MDHQFSIFADSEQLAQKHHLSWVPVEDITTQQNYVYHLWFTQGAGL